MPLKSSTSTCPAANLARFTPTGFTALGPAAEKERSRLGSSANASGEVGVLTGVLGALPLTTGLVTGFAEPPHDGQSNVRVLSAAGDRLAV